MKTTEREAARYVLHIRNKEKKRYAWAYMQYLYLGTPEPDANSYGVSGMATQAVRLALREIKGLV